MNSEIIKAVHEAESSAGEIIKNAQIRAKEINAEAKAKAEAAASSAHAQARQQSQTVFEAARAEAQKEVAGFMDRNRQEGEALMGSARAHLHEAQDYIIGRIVK